MTITVSRNALIFVLAVIALGAIGYFIGSQVNKPPAGPTMVTATLPAAVADALAPQPQVVQPTLVPDTAPRISMADFKQQLDQRADMIIVDVRTADQYNLAHIPGAVNIPEMEVPNRLAELPKDKQIVLYCN